MATSIGFIAGAAVFTGLDFLVSRKVHLKGNGPIMLLRRKRGWRFLLGP